VHFMRRQAPRLPPGYHDKRGRDLEYRLHLLVAQCLPPGACPATVDEASAAAAAGGGPRRPFIAVSLASPPFRFRTRPTGHLPLCALPPPPLDSFSLPRGELTMPLPGTSQLPLR